MNVKAALLISGAAAMLVSGALVLGATLYPAPEVQTILPPVATLRPTQPPKNRPKPTLPQGAVGLDDPLPPIPTLPPYIPPRTPNRTSRPETPANARTVLTGRKIGIDPRGQQFFQGTRDAFGVRTGIFAHEINLAVAKRLRTLLQGAGATVVMTRESGAVDISDLHRAQMLNDADAALAIRIACGSSDDPNVSGADLITPAGAAAATIEARSKVAGELLLQELTAATGNTVQGIRTREDGGFNWSNVPVCEIVLGYVSNEREDILLSDATYLDRCANGLFNGLIKFFQ